MRGWFTGLWRHPDFLHLWAAQTISWFGTQISMLAIPLTAAVTLQATPFQMGLLAAAERAPYLLISLFAGVWVDRWRRRPILISTDLGRAALLAFVPAAAFLGVLRFELLLAVALAAGTLAVLFEVAHLSFLPSVVEREQLVEANSKVQATESVSQIAGPGLGGVLVGLVGAPFAVAIDACSFLLSALFITRIRTPEPAPTATAPRRDVWREIGEGMRFVGGHPILRPLIGISATTGFFGFLFMAVYVLFLVRELGLGPAVIGLVLGIGGVGALIGALLAGPLARRLGPGPTIVWAELLFAISNLLVPLILWVPPVAIPALFLSELLAWMALGIRNVNAMSARQALTPDRLLGRVNATHRFLAFGAMPIGSLIGGALGELIGLGPTLLVGVVGMLGSFAWAVLSPLRTLRALPSGERV
jgi:MFS family permease